MPLFCRIFADRQPITNERKSVIIVVSESGFQKKPAFFYLKRGEKKLNIT